MSSLSAAVVEPQPVPGASEEEAGGHRGQDGSPEESYCHMKNCDMYPPRERVVGMSMKLELSWIMSCDCHTFTPPPPQGATRTLCFVDYTLYRDSANPMA